MCLIVYKEGKEAHFTNRQFKNMINRNRDGLGIMWREKGRVKVEKSIGSARDKFQLWQKHRNRSMYAMHSRLTTHGNTNLDNCHPYEILNKDKGDPIDLYMMHNGVLSQAPNVDSKMSDTWHFIEYILKPIAKTNLNLLWESEEFQSWLQKTISGSKFLFMRSDDIKHPILILNAAAGKDETGCWLSNTYSTNGGTVHRGATSYNYNGGTQSKANPTSTPASTNVILGPTRTEDLKHTTVMTKDGEIPWNEFIDKKKLTVGQTGYSQDRTSKLFLPDNSKESKIVELKKSEVKIHLPESVNPDQQLLEIVFNLSGLAAHSVKEWVKEDPDTAVDVVLAFYEKNTMTPEVIYQQIADDRSIDGIVDIIRHIASGKPSIRNVS